MAFGEDFNSLFPSYLVGSEKNRLTEALKQFYFKNGPKSIDYTGFYKSSFNDYFIQSDLVRQIRMPFWDDKECEFIKSFPDALILSNTCDLSVDNHREFNTKECVLAPLVELGEYINEMLDFNFTADKIKEHIDKIKSQQISNLFYLPPNKGLHPEYIVKFDQVYWFPSIELSHFTNDLAKNRIASLSLFGHYLFILKLSYHLCRLPEDGHRLH
jgi:hypothetical protein